MKVPLPFRLHRDLAGRLVLTDEQGNTHVGIEPVRTFPISEPDRLISLLDSHGRELACLANLANLASDRVRRTAHGVCLLLRRF